MSGAGVSAVYIAAGLLQIPLLLAYLPKDVAGLWLLFLSFGGYLGLFDLGFGPTISREVSFVQGRAALHAGERLCELREIHGTMRSMYRVLAAGVLLVGGTIGYFAVRSLTPAAHAAEMTTAWVVFAVGAALSVNSGGYLSMLNGFGDVAMERAIRATSILAGLALMFLALRSGFGVMGLAIAWICQTGMQRLAAGLVLRRRHVELVARRAPSSRTRFRRMLGPSLRWAGMSLGAVVILQTGNIVIAAVLGSAQIPPYEAISKMAMGLASVAFVLAQSASPFLSRYHAAGDTASFHRLMLLNTRYVMALVGAVTATLALFGDVIVAQWLGVDNYAGDPVLWVLLAMVCLEVHHRALAIAVMATGRIVFLTAAFAAGAINLMLAIVLAPRYGLFGVALATALAQFTTNNWYVPFTAFRQFGIGFGEYVRGVVIPFASVFTATLTGFVAVRTTHAWEWGAGVRLIVVGIALATVLAMVWGVLAPEHREWLRAKLMSRNRSLA